MRACLDEIEGNSALSRASRCIAEQVKFRMGNIGVDEIRSDLCGVPSAFNQEQLSVAKSSCLGFLHLPTHAQSPNRHAGRRPRN